MNEPLSPASAAVDFAVYGPSPDATRRQIAAAALRAAADQVVPEEPHPGESQFWDDEAKQEWQNNQHFRNHLLAIAAELEAQ